MSAVYADRNLGMFIEITFKTFHFREMKREKARLCGEMRAGQRVIHRNLWRKCFPVSLPLATIKAPRTGAGTPAGADHHNAIGTQRSDGL